MSNLLPQDGEAFYHPTFLNPSESSDLFKDLWRVVPWKHEPITLFGKKVLQPRLTAWYGDVSYRYSGTTMQPSPWPKDLLELKERIEETSGARYNSVLLNLYRNGNDSMGWHRDDEKELGANPTISSLSLGATRRFHFKHIRQDLKVKIQLESGGLLVMKGATQHLWYHCVPKQAGVSDSRINLTFRMVAQD